MVKSTGCSSRGQRALHACGVDTHTGKTSTHKIQQNILPRERKQDTKKYIFIQNYRIDKYNLGLALVAEADFQKVPWNFLEL